jgi:hypothetical protein
LEDFKGKDLFGNADREKLHQIQQSPLSLDQKIDRGMGKCDLFRSKLAIIFLHQRDEAKRATILAPRLDFSRFSRRAARTKPKDGRARRQDADRASTMLSRTDCRLRAQHKCR